MTKHGLESPPAVSTVSEVLKRHYFGEIIFIALAAMIFGMEGFDDLMGFLRRNNPRMIGVYLEEPVKSSMAKLGAASTQADLIQSVKNGAELRLRPR